MRKPKSLSHEFVDALVELYFRELPALPEEDLARLLDAVMRLANREVLRGAAQAWDACVEMTKDSVELAMICERQRTFDKLLEQFDCDN